MFHRIKKVLASEYVQFYEEVIVESPFAQITSDKEGLRAVQIALTQNNLIIATDKFLNGGQLWATSCNLVDPEVDTMELLQIIPLRYLRFQLIRKSANDNLYMKVIYQRDSHKAWKFFEFSGHFLKYFYWNLWMDRLQKLKQEQEEALIESSGDSSDELVRICHEAFSNVYREDSSLNSHKITSSDQISPNSKARKV